MKIIFFSLLILFSAKAFSQSDTAYKTENVFLVSYTNYDSKTVEFKEIRLTSIDSISLTFEEVVWGPTEKKNNYIPHTIVFDRINSFGYKTGIGIGGHIGRGALAGFTVGFILGAIEGKFNPVGDGSGKPSGADRVGTGFLFGIAGAIPGALAGTIIGAISKEYEVLDISKQNRKKKFEIIKRLIKAGVKENE